ncbi:NAD(P)H-hydrate epimerase [Neisseria canis]|uniref:NAD(P)H-hydrate epimerase n=1 Tax=Neisseria canis TaxID=493 RepID=A0A1X3CYC8_9NEIS|nr:NAD(P)H-hydrate epimerase [Neisseria canis]OSI12670.1 NAD(P)H-hydrate epimerase [Neisseria canis]VEF02676.1 Nicotinamide nucleotide repair protein [Neisseria canis]
MKVYTAEEMRRHEQMAVDKGISFAQLMENAGSAAADDLLKRFPQAGSALIVCGKGNNGGDGLVIARILQAAGWQADIVFVLGNELSPLAESNRQKLLNLHGIEFAELNACLKKPYDLIIDGIFGTGFTGSLPQAVAETCRSLNAMLGAKIALDIPTGLNCDTAEADADTFRADITYTFAAYKPAHLHDAGKAYCGETLCLDIGIE